MHDNPFKAGTVVAITVQNGWRAPISFKRAIVSKVFKNGNFALEGSPQQWRAHSPSAGWENFWKASATGSGNGTLRIWDATTSDDIDTKNAIAARYRRFTDAATTIERRGFSELVTDEVVAQIEAVAAALKLPKSAEAT